jgi:hypothetical protein
LPLSTAQVHNGWSSTSNHTHIHLVWYLCRRRVYILALLSVI